MTTLVTFHAHPDDESIATGGIMAKAASEGHRVVLVVATRGEHGEIVPGVLGGGEQLGIRRVQETYDAAEVLGVDRVEFLGYVDSGMMGEPTNDTPGSFWSTDVASAANRLATIVREEGADDVVLTIYDDHGGYGHPDHIQVHRVGRRAAELAEVRRVYEATSNRDETLRNLAEAAEEGDHVDIPDAAAMADFGTPAAQITTAVDVGAFTTVKRRALGAHRSQIDEASFFMAMDDDDFTRVFGTEWFIRVDADVPVGLGPSRRETSLFADGVGS
jgi:LmbE family N-acetylglucosaminyl deacetylase